MNRNYFLVALVLVFIFLSCNKNDLNPENKLKVIQPLGVGYNWTYIDSIFFNGSKVQVDTSKVGITGKEIVSYEGKDVELFYWNWYDFKEQGYRNYSWLCNNETNGHNYYGQRLEDSTFVIARTMNLKYPVNVGETWSTFHFGHEISSDTMYCYQSDTIIYECISVNEKFLTKLGELDCIVYKFSVTANNDVYEYLKSAS